MIQGRGGGWLSLIDPPAAGSQRHTNNTNTPDRYCIDISLTSHGSDRWVEVLPADTAPVSKASRVCDPLHWVSSFRGNWSPGSNKAGYPHTGQWIGRRDWRVNSTASLPHADGPHHWVEEVQLKTDQFFSLTLFNFSLWNDSDWDTILHLWVSLLPWFYVLHVELIQLRCGRNKTVIRFSTLKFIVLLLLLFPMVHSGISKYLFFSLPFFHPSLSFSITAVAVTAEVIRAWKLNVYVKSLYVSIAAQYLPGSLGCLLSHQCKSNTDMTFMTSPVKTCSH